jgi:hypothetical protein
MKRAMIPNFKADATITKVNNLILLPSQALVTRGESCR